MWEHFYTENIKHTSHSNSHRGSTANPHIRKTAATASRINPDNYLGGLQGGGHTENIPKRSQF